jgi:hypothetical protein
MSAFGTKRTFGEHPSMSAFGGKADMDARLIIPSEVHCECARAFAVSRIGGRESLCRKRSGV